MKNKKLIYILVPLTMVIWGLIIHRIFHGFGNDPPQGAAYSPPIHKSPENAQDTAALLLNYSDPFLEGTKPIAIVKKEQPELLSNRQSLAPRISDAAPFPPVQYYGLVSNSKNKNQKVAMIRIDNRSYLAKEKEVLEGITVSLICNDSVILAFNGHKQAFFKNK